MWFAWKFKGLCKLIGNIGEIFKNRPDTVSLYFPDYLSRSHILLINRVLNKAG
jgi:hypothetical protein